MIKITPLSRSVHRAVYIPGSKSYTNRALLMAAMTLSPVVISNPLFSDDTRAMINCLQRLGIKVQVDKDQIVVVGDITHVEDKEYILDADLSGTTIRFILALCCIVPGVKILSGKSGLNKRPIADLVDGLLQLGAKIEYLDRVGYPPLRIDSSKLKAGTVKMRGSVSSQYLSSLLMIAPIVGEITIELLDKQISKPYIDMTIDTLEHFGIQVQNNDYKSYVVRSNQHYKAKSYTVEGDVSSAAYFAAIATLTHSTITLHNINPKSVQADMRFLHILKQMGSNIVYKEQGITIEGHGVRPLEVDMEDCPDQVQTMAVLAAFASGVTRINGVQSLRVKETNRVLAIEQELTKMGVKVESSEKTLVIHGGTPKATIVATYGDHRMAMAFAVAGAKLAKMRIADPQVVSKTFPDFWERLNEIGVISQPDPRNIILIGMRGSGKSTVAKLLKKSLGLNHIDLDEMIVNNLGASITEIVIKHGWDYFRQQESKLAQSLNVNNTIISTGGGIVLNPDNLTHLKLNGQVILLRAHPDKLAERIGYDPNRPALVPNVDLKTELKKVWSERQSLYEKSADAIIDVDFLSPDEVAEKVIQAYL